MALAAKSVPSVKPIKPFGAEGVRSPVVLPVRPQPHSEPPSREPTPAPLHKAGSLPSSLHSSALSTPGRRRRPSGARHSSPIKSAAPPSITTLSLFNTPNTDLSALLAGVRRTASPQIQHAATSHLTTSTPFHADLNLSTVILDHLTHNTSISPLVVGEAACRPTATKVSVGGELCLPPAPPVTLAEEWAAPSVYCTHCRHALDLPLHHALDAPLDVVARVTEVVVGACRLAADQWEEVVALPLGVEWRVVVGPSDTALRLPLVLRHPGVLSLTLQLATPDGGVSTGLARLRVEDANIQLLTENGGSLDFGALAEECTAEEQLMLVNCGQAEVPVHLELATATGPFTLEGGVRAIDFVLPGVEGDGAVPGQGVARSAMVVASTVGVSAAEVTVRTAELLVGLGQDTSTLLGSLAMGVKVGRARLRTRRAEEAVELRCAPGQAAAGQVPLHNSGNIPLQLRLEVADTPEGAFTLPTTLTLEPEVSTYLNVQFTAAEGATPASTAHTLHLSVEPRGPKHLISLHTTIITSPSKPFRSTSKPTLSFGVMKKEQEMRGEVQEFTKFPVECDKSHVNFLCVPPGGSEEQSLTLRNSTREVVTLTAITRESDRFTLMTAGGAVTSVAVELGPGMTHELRAVYRPLEVGEARGKLVLKPQGRRVGGKAFKASIGLFGLCGKTEVEMEGLERTENNIYRLVCNKFPATKVISFVNRGDFAAFIKVVPEVLGQGEAWGQVEVVAPGEVVVPRGEVRQVAVTCPAGPAALVVFRGPEVARQLMRRARQLPGAARLSDDPALLGEDMAAAVRGEELLAEGERWGGGRVATAHDVRHFYQLTSKSLVRVAVPAAPQEFGCLAVEETLSETRLEQSVVIGAHSPPTREEVGVSMSPRLLTLARGSEGVVRLANRGLATATWELVWPQAEMQVHPSAGSLAPCGQAVLCVTALAGRPAWRGALQLYCDNSVDTLEVVVTEAPSAAPPRLVAAPAAMELGLAVIGSTTTRTLTLTNPGATLVQWRANVQPSFFSLPLSCGLLNPSQGVGVAVHYRPGAPGTHAATLALTAAPVQGGDSSAPTLVTLRGEAVALSQAATGHARPAPAAAKKLVGGVTLESRTIEFPDTRVGDTTVAKMKIKNRSPSDQVVAVSPLPASSPYRIGQAEVEVKRGCYLNLPVQFHPCRPGLAEEEVRLEWEGATITATLRGSAL